jgi:hypothetical protein
MDMGMVVLIFPGNNLVQSCATVREKQVRKNFAYYKIIFSFVLSGGCNHDAQQVDCCLSFSYLKPKY